MWDHLQRVANVGVQSRVSPRVVGACGDRILLGKHKFHYTSRCTLCNDNTSSNKERRKREHDPGTPMSTPENRHHNCLTRVMHTIYGAATSNSSNLRSKLKSVSVSLEGV